jgi:hypothetical protein
MAQLPRFLRVSSRDGTAMNETKAEQGANSIFAVKHEESLELLKAFLMIKDQRLRAEIISSIKKTASGQTQ